MYLTIGIIVAVIILIVVFVISSYNKINRANLMVENQWSQIDTEIEKRFSLIPNLVNTVKGYADHESKTLEEITKMRSNYDEANTPEQKQALISKMDEMMRSFQMNVNVENYPDLKANTNFLELQEQLTTIENDIALQRKLYNDAITKYNLLVTSFPSNIIASIFRFSKKEQFSASVEATTVPSVEF